MGVDGYFFLIDRITMVPNEHEQTVIFWRIICFEGGETLFLI